MVKVTLYGDKISTCTRSVLILLEELNLNYIFNNVDLSKGEHKNEKFIKMNPFGKVPILEYGKRTLIESRVMLKYIAKKNRDIEDFMGDINTDMWLEIENNQYYPIVSKLVYEKVFKKMKGEKADQNIVDEYLQKYNEVLKIYDQHLKNNKYLAGDSFTIADIAHIPYTYYFLKSGANEDEKHKFRSMFKQHRNVYDWFHRLLSRDAVKSVLSGQFLQDLEESKLPDDEEQSGEDVEPGSAVGQKVVT